MELASRIEAEKELSKMGAEQLRREQVAIANDLKRLQDQLGDLAFNNYRTYANASRTAQHCHQTFSDINGILTDISQQLPALSSELHDASRQARSQRLECEILKGSTSPDCPTRKILEMPALMDVCIRTGSYDAAYALTNFGMTLQQQVALMRDSEYKKLFQEVSDRLIAARSFLLEELFNKFAGPMELSESIQVVKNVRKIPYLTNTQLRVSVLLYRDVYLDKQILEIQNNAEFALRAIEIFRSCMYDTMVLYMAVFPENEVARRDPSIDPRWELWPASGPYAVLSEWAVRNTYRLLELIERADMKSQVDMSAVWSKLMAFGASFGRMGLDFRPLVVDSLTALIKKRFANAIRQATHKLVNEEKRIEVHSGSANYGFSNIDHAGGPPQPSAEISMCDVFCAYGNNVLEALNGLRFSLSPILLPFVVSTIRESLRSVFSWLGAHANSPHFSRAVQILAVHLVDFFNKCILFYFPHSTISRLYGSSLQRHEYEKLCDLNMRQILEECDGGEFMKQVLEAELDPPKVDDATIEHLLAPTTGQSADFEHVSASPPASIPQPFEIVDVEQAPPAQDDEVVIPPSSPKFTLHTDSTVLSDMDISSNEPSAISPPHHQSISPLPTAKSISAEVVAPERTALNAAADFPSFPSSNSQAMLNSTFDEAVVTASTVSSEANMHSTVDKSLDDVDIEHARKDESSPEAFAHISLQQNEAFEDVEDIVLPSAHSPKAVTSASVTSQITSEYETAQSSHSNNNLVTSRSTFSTQASPSQSTLEPAELGHYDQPHQSTEPTTEGWGWGQEPTDEVNLASDEDVEPPSHTMPPSTKSSKND